MPVNSVNPGSNYVSQVQPQPQTQAERTADKDRDDAAKAAAAAANASRSTAQPTVNTSGQTVGAVINVKA